MENISGGVNSSTQYFFNNSTQGIAMNKKLILGPDQCIFDAAAICGTAESEKGIMLFSENRKLLHFITEPDKEVRKFIKVELSKVITELAEGRTYKPQWPIVPPFALFLSQLPLFSNPQMDRLSCS